MVIGPRRLGRYHSGCSEGCCHMGEGPIRKGVVLENRRNEGSDRSA